MLLERANQSRPAGALRADDMVPVPFAKEALDEGDAAPLLAR